jgi:hypothetical protein
MSYTTAIPITGDSLGGTRDRIRTNFQLISSVFAANHVTYNLTGAGKHNFLQMPEVTASGVGPPVTQVNEAGFYADVGTNPAEANLFFRAENSAGGGAGGFIYQLTRSYSSATGTFGKNPGWTFLPGGILMFYGTIAPTSSNAPVNFAGLGLPNFQNPPYNIQVTRQRTTSSPGSSFGYYVDNTTVATTGFTIINADGHTYGYYWTAIGV